MLPGGPQTDFTGSHRNPRLCLGYRGVIVRRTKTDDGVWDKAMSSKHALPRRLPARVVGGEGGIGCELAAQDSPQTGRTHRRRRNGSGLAGHPRPSGARPRTAGARSISAVPRRKCRPIIRSSPARNRTKRGGPAVPTTFRRTQYFFNDPAHVTRNNCYCFASNHMPDIRYARPGQRAGRRLQFMTCGSVIEGLRADGWVDGCQPTTSPLCW